MAWTLATLRDYVRGHMDLDDQDLTSTMLDAWAREITERIAAKRDRWYFYEAEWDFDTANGVGAYELSQVAPNVDEINAVVVDGSRVLTWIGPEEATMRYVSTSESASPTWWTVRAGSLRLYPTPSSVETVRLVGWRRVDDWVTAGTSPDCPTEFHSVVRNWMLGSAYLQQEDTELGITHLDMAEDELNKLARKYGDSPAAAPLVVSGRGLSPRAERMRWPWE